MKEKAFLMSGLVVIAAMVFIGCETLKGAKKDIENTVAHIKKTPEFLRNVDQKFQNNAW